MADERYNVQNGNCEFKDACCIDAGRVYDSCCDRDCVEDLRCYFTPEGQNYIEKAVSVKIKNAEVLNVYINVEPVNFNRGFFSCDLTFLFLIEFDVYLSAHSCPVQIKGLANFNKRVILYGSDGNVKVFSNTVSEDSCEQPTKRTTNMPKCVVQSVDPIPLGCRLGQVNDRCECIGVVPAFACELLGGQVVSCCECGTPAVFVTLGLFSVIQLIRNVQMLIPVYDFCIPDKQCTDTTDQPCDIFRKIKFPTDDFFPPRNRDTDNTGCGCNKNDD